MNRENETPLLLQFLFGEAAALAQEGASPRLLCWCQAMDDWLAERQGIYTHKTFTWSYHAWKGLLSHSGQLPWKITPADIRQYNEWLEASEYTSSTIHSEFGLLAQLYVWCAQHQVEPDSGLAFNPAGAAAALRPGDRNGGCESVGALYRETRPIVYPSDAPVESRERGTGASGGHTQRGDRGGDFGGE